MDVHDRYRDDSGPTRGEPAIVGIRGVRLGREDSASSRCGRESGHGLTSWAASWVAARPAADLGSCVSGLAGQQFDEQAFGVRHQRVSVVKLAADVALTT